MLAHLVTSDRIEDQIVKLVGRMSAEPKIPTCAVGGSWERSIPRYARCIAAPLHRCQGQTMACTLRAKWRQAIERRGRRRRHWLDVMREHDPARTAR
jgi:hypothetical protein